MGTGEFMGRQRGSCVPFLSLCTRIRAIHHTARIEFSISCGGEQTIVSFLRLGTTLQLRCRCRRHQPPFSYFLSWQPPFIFYLIVVWAHCTLVGR